MDLPRYPLPCKEFGLMVEGRAEDVLKIVFPAVRHLYLKSVICSLSGNTIGILQLVAARHLSRTGFLSATVTEEPRSFYISDKNDTA